MSTQPQPRANATTQQEIERNFVTSRLSSIASELSAKTGVPMKLVVTDVFKRDRELPPNAMPRYDRQIADAYDVPPWLVDPAYNTRHDRMWWCFRYARRAWRWLQRKTG